jgi:single-strand DNA-binding protein
MNSFTLTAIGQLAADPETGGEGERRFTKFALIGNDYNGPGKEQIATTVFFVAFSGIGEAIAKNCRKGDQLIIEAQMRSSNWVDNQDRRHYDYSYVCQGFRFGAPGKAKRAELAEQAAREG